MPPFISTQRNNDTLYYCKEIGNSRLILTPPQLIYHIENDGTGDSIDSEPLEIMVQDYASSETSEDVFHNESIQN